MGCDIHIWAEVKKRYGNPDYRPGWEVVGHEFPYEYYRPGETSVVLVSGDEPDWESNRSMTMEPYNGRNYVLFAILADVRNGFGIEPITAPRGIPEDASAFYKREVEKWGADGHSHSWLTLDELRRFDWGKDADSVGYFLTETMPRLEAIEKRDDVEEMRLVFFFDN